MSISLSEYNFWAMWRSALKATWRRFLYGPPGRPTGSTWDSIPYNDRLLATTYILEKLLAHSIEGGTFRHLIYHRLAFGEDAYVPLCRVGGVELSNKLLPPGDE